MGKGAPTARTEALADIWQRVLDRPFVDVGDNFFELGGDPSSAVHLFKEVAKVYGRELSPVRIYQAPTVGAMAVLLEQLPAPPFPTLVLLKAGPRKPAIFVAHGLGGTVMEIFHLVNAIQSEHPIFGLQSSGFDGDEEPLTRVEDTARRYFDAIKEQQPRGPYVLVGYSFGGLVMLEIAQRLRDSGERVALLEMIETYPHNNLLPLTRRLALFADRVKRHVGILLRLPMSKKIAYLTNHEERVQASWNHGSYSEPPETGLLYGPARDRFNRAGIRALVGYQPGFYHGKISFIKAAKVSSFFPDDPRGVWQKLAAEFEIESVQGDHFSMVTTDCEALAAVISRHLATAFSEECE
jgi:acetoacetyl-CoA synthetase